MENQKEMKVRFQSFLCLCCLANPLLVQLIEHPKYWHFWMYFDINLKILSGKKHSKSKQTKYSEFVKMGV